jgi:hypothetical protein
MNPDSRTLAYSFGNQYGPNGIHGRFELEIATQGGKTVVTLAHKQLDQQRSWTAVLSADTEQAIWSALQKSDFPNTARPEALVPDETICSISVTNSAVAPDTVRTSLPLDRLKELPGYAELVPLLDTIISQITDESTEKTSVSAIEQY